MKKYTTFRIGDTVSVIPSERELWDSLTIIENHSGPYTVKDVRRSPCVYCAGHPQQLVLNNDCVVSGQWFDENTPSNRTIHPKSCDSGGPMGDTWESPAPHHQASEYDYLADADMDAMHDALDEIFPPDRY